MPTYDASGNQTLIKTSTGIWTVVYNAANRAVSFTSQDGSTVVECGYDYQGRRYMKKVTVNGTVASHERYLYRGYLQLAALDMLDNRNVLRTLLWDPLEPVATRPPWPWCRKMPFTAMEWTLTRTSRRCSLERELLRQLMTTRHTDRLFPRGTSSSRCSGPAR